MRTKGKGGKKDGEGEPSKAWGQEGKGSKKQTTRRNGVIIFERAGSQERTAGEVGGANGKKIRYTKGIGQ